MNEHSRKAIISGVLVAAFAMSGCDYSAPSEQGERVTGYSLGMKKQNKPVTGYSEVWLDMDIFPDILKRLDRTLDTEVKMGAITPEQAAEIKAAAELLAKNRPQSLLDGLWERKGFQNPYALIDYWTMRADFFIDQLSPSLGSLVREYKDINGCYLTSKSQGKCNIRCENDRVTLIALNPNSANIQKIYDYLEKAAFYREIRNQNVTDFVVLPFNQMAPARAAEITRLKSDIDLEIQQNIRDHIKKFEELWPKIQYEMAKATTVPGSALSAPAPVPAPSR